VVVVAVLKFAALWTMMKVGHLLVITEWIVLETLENHQSRKRPRRKLRWTSTQQHCRIRGLVSRLGHGGPG